MLQCWCAVVLLSPASEADRSFRTGASNSAMTVDSWNMLCDYSCWAGHFLENCQVPAAELTVIETRIIEQDWMAAFRQHVNARDPKYSLEDFPMWEPLKATHGQKQVFKEGDIETLDMARKESQFKTDLLALTRDAALFMKYFDGKAKTSKARKLAQNAHVRLQVHKGRSDIIQPFMETSCKVLATRDIPTALAVWQDFVKSAPVGGGSGHLLRIAYTDFNKLGRVTDSELDSMIRFLADFMAPHPQSSCAVVLLTSVTSRKRSGGGKWLLAFGQLFMRLFKCFPQTLAQCQVLELSALVWRRSA